METARIENVSDTALWVAYYRAKESERPDALFQDPLAKQLIGERGRLIAGQMDQLSAFTEFNVITRTVIIDEFILSLANEVDTIVNLGAGLDTRPYRLSLPKELRWIEVDFPHILGLKNERLKNEAPTCRLERVDLDLSDDEKRRAFLSSLAGRVLVLMEGVIPYLTQDQVRTLGQDLHSNPAILYWIADYLDPRVYPHLRDPQRLEKLKNAPFQFFPENWLGFFANLGWVPERIEYNQETGFKLGRMGPFPFWIKLLCRIAPGFRRKLGQISGYVLFRKA